MRRSILLAGLLTLFTASSAHAGLSVPSAFNSQFSPCLVLCPEGDIAFQGVVRDQGGGTIPNSVVRLDFSQCPSFAHCNQGAPYLYNDAERSVRLSTDSQGRVFFGLMMGGLCPGAKVNIYADGVLMGTRTLASPDQDGDLQVRNDDVAAIAARVGTSDATANVNCSAGVDGSDVTFAQAHLDHACPVVVDVRSRTWGVLKLHYR